MDDGTGQPVVTSWGKTHESQSSFFHEKTQHDGTGPSVVDEEKLHDRTWQPVVIPQREMWPQQFIIGKDETEPELSVESGSFSSRVNDQVRNRQKRSSMKINIKGRSPTMSSSWQAVNNFLADGAGWKARALVGFTSLFLRPLSPKTTS